MFRVYRVLSDWGECSICTGYYQTWGVNVPYVQGVIRLRGECSVCIVCYQTGVNVPYVQGVIRHGFVSFLSRGIFVVGQTLVQSWRRQMRLDMHKYSVKSLVYVSA